MWSTIVLWNTNDIQTPPFAPPSRVATPPTSSWQSPKINHLHPRTLSSLKPRKFCSEGRVLRATVMSSPGSSIICVISSRSICFKFIRAFRKRRIWCFVRVVSGGLFCGSSDISIKG
ncbi:unnamed protein product [Tuber aestivum]|uniref:Uncharacterized protein n=1 Tax=Tuber aestivum TaxID=59557 RepID=A0A292PNY4_9PEZI|nr:unnamed protein product [Tuber aestivum]